MNIVRAYRLKRFENMKQKMMKLNSQQHYKHLDLPGWCTPLVTLNALRSGLERPCVITDDTNLK